MKKPIIVIKIKPKQYKKLIVLAESVHEALFNNVNFMNPQPTLNELSLTLLATKDAATKWGSKENRGSHEDYLDLMVQSFRLHKILTQLGEWCMSSMDPDMPYPEQSVLLSTCGFPLKKEKAPQGLLEAVQDIHRFISRNLREGLVKISWKRPLNVTTPTNVKGFLVYRGKSTVFSEATVIAVVSKTTYTDEPGAGIWNYWVTPFNNKGEGVVSEIVVVRIAEGL